MGRNGRFSPGLWLLLSLDSRIDFGDVSVFTFVPEISEGFRPMLPSRSRESGLLWLGLCCSLKACLPDLGEGKGLSSGGLFPLDLGDRGLVRGDALLGDRRGFDWDKALLRDLGEVQELAPGKSSLGELGE